MKIAGLMSGTSLDGLTIGIISIEKPKTFSTLEIKKLVREAKFLGGKDYPFPKRLREQLSEIASVESRFSTAFLARANSEFGRFCADRVKKFLDDEIDLIGFHGQTVYHEPGSPTVTFQLGDPSPICLAANSPVVSDLRTMDTATGGQGAPLVPMVDYLRYGDAKKSRIILNLGGIANFTYIPRDSRIGDVRAFDVGPANILIDGAVKELYGSSKDEGGKIAFHGKVSKDLMDRILEQDDFRFVSSPKSTGRERYSESFLRKVLESARELSLPREDIIATLSRYSIFMINYHIQMLLKEDSKRNIDEVIVGGGGSKNKFLLSELAKLDGIGKVSVHDNYGVPARFWETFSFAILAFLSYHQIAGNVPSATGASQSVVLGRINYPVMHQVS